MPPAQRDATVLILSTDAVTSALLSILVELEGFRPVYAGRDEPPTASLARLRPRVVLVDCRHHDACDDEFIDCARQVGTRVVVFSPGRMSDDVRAFAEERALPWFSLPIDRASLASTVRTALTALLPFAIFAALPH